MTIQYLVGLKIGPQFYTNADLKKLCKEIDEYKTIPEIKGVELRFKGEITQNDIQGGLLPNQILEVCDCAKGTFPLLNLHLSEFGLDIMRGNYKGKKIDAKEFIEQFNFIIGHYNEHEDLFGKIMHKSYETRKDGSRFGAHKSYKGGLSSILQDEDLPLELQEKFLIENGTKDYNCLRVVYGYASTHNLNMTFDMGHLVASWLEYDPKTDEPYDDKSNYVTKENGRYFYKTKYLATLGSRAKHLHIHGLKGHNGEFTDHEVLNDSTMRGSQIGVVKRIIGPNKRNIVTATVELNRPTKGSVTETIQNFDQIFHQAF